MPIARCLFLLSLSLHAQENWDQPFPPHRIADNLYYVGSAGLSTYLVTTPQGHIVINASFERTVPIIRANVEKLGFKMRDVKILLSSHAHNDHVGGLKALRDATGGKVFVMAGDDSVVSSGGKGQYLYDETWNPCPVDRVLKNGDVVRLGDAELRAHLTPGHTRGNTTWTLPVTDRGRKLQAVIIGSPNVNRGFQLVNNKDYPEIAADFARTFRVLKSLSCDIFLGAHGMYYDMEAKVKRLANGGENPFVDPKGYREYVAEREEFYLYTLENQQKAAAAK
jgi:metallo-beta-lactamase class B